MRCAAGDAVASDCHVYRGAHIRLGEVEAMIEQQHQHEAAVGLAKAAPAVGVTGMSVSGVLENIPLHELVLLATLVYTLFMLYFLLRDKWWKPRQAAKRKADKERVEHDEARNPTTKKKPKS